MYQDMGEWRVYVHVGVRVFVPKPFWDKKHKGGQIK